ncbi:MAG: hypothetical protein AAFU56_02665 [Pseudomonadota bacterium]
MSSHTTTIIQTEISGAKSRQERDRARSAATASYLADMLSELRAMSQKEGWPMLTYFMEMAIVEAHAINNNGAGAFPQDDQKTILVPDSRAQLLAEKFLAGELD